MRPLQRVFIETRRETGTWTRRTVSIIYAACGIYYVPAVPLPDATVAAAQCCIHCGTRDSDVPRPADCDARVRNVAKSVPHGTCLHSLRTIIPKCIASGHTSA